MGSAKPASRNLLWIVLTGASSLSVPNPILADTLTVAVASNFAETLELIVEEFEAAHQHEVRLVRGSSGNHYAQIINGAPFDLFFSADQARPQALLDSGRVESEQVADYAQGQLVLWEPASNDSRSIRTRFESLSFDRLALANPKLAPYGRASQQVLEALDIAQQLRPEQIISGENVAQAYQFIATGNVSLGFVALSQVIDHNPAQLWLIPQQYYQPIVQQRVTLTPSVATATFIDFFASEQVSSILQQQGYILPSND